jgi:hypothetical protein
MESSGIRSFLTAAVAESGEELHAKGSRSGVRARSGSSARHYFGKCYAVEVVEVNHLET